MKVHVASDYYNSAFNRDVQCSCGNLSFYIESKRINQYYHTSSVKLVITVKCTVCNHFYNFVYKITDFYYRKENRLLKDIKVVKV